MKVFYSLSGMLDHANTLIDQKDVISLDIFDTLFVRRIYDPDLVKAPVARFVTEKAAGRGISITWQEVQAIRNRIEAEQRARNGANHPDHEANYDEFMPETLRHIFEEAYSDDLFHAVADYEMAMESAVLAPRVELVDWLRHLKQKNKKVILISDIYLPAKYLKRLVRDKGLSDYVADVVSSADTFRAKASGTGFNIVLENHAIEPHRWLHIGDNIISDGTRPSGLGIDALVIHDVGEKQRKGIARLIHSLAGIRHIWKGRNVLQLMMPLEGDNTEHPELFIDGHNLFGMLIGYFLHCLAEKCKERNIQRIYFCSREGWMFFECWKRMAPHLFAGGTAPEARYLYVSRMGLSSAACANAGLTATNATVALLPFQNMDFMDICRVYKLDIEPLRPYLDRAGLDPEDHIVLVSADGAEGANPDNPFSVLMDDEAFQREVKKQGVESRQLFEQYLDSEGFFDHREVALVDIGWLGTIQHYLHQAISHRGNRPHIHGFLLAATRMVPYPYSEENRCEGLVFDQHRFSLATSYVLTIKDVLEEICRAPHPSVLGYEQVNGKTQPRFRTRSDEAAQSELKQSEYYTPLHQGIFHGVEKYALSVTLLGYESKYIRSWLNFYLVSRVAFPTSGELKRIKHFFHQDDFAGERTVNQRILRYFQSLWDVKPWKIALVPCIRYRYYYRHISRMLRLWA
jgi:predicted HAD superfamily hydrolase